VNQGVDLDLRLESLVITGNLLNITVYFLDMLRNYPVLSILAM